MQSFYNKYRKIIEYVIYPLALIILPVMNYNQGVDVSDSTYSLGNYLFADGLDGMWMMSTYLSNLFGKMLLKLPGATSLRIANIYTGLLLGAIGLMIYLILKTDFDARYVFLGEFAAISFCWIPTGILYNYLSYFVMAAGALALYKGIMKDSKKYLFLAGILLGMNVFVRIPNITQMALIVALWFACFVQKKNVVKPTLVCIGGYAVGVGLPAGILVAKYKIEGILDMISGLSGITSTDETYTPLSMITGPIKAYIKSFRWIALVILVVACGVIMFKVLPKKMTAIKVIVYVAVIALMVRFFWGRGMFSFRYYEDYTSIYEWVVMVLLFSIAVDIYVIAKAVLERTNDIATGRIKKSEYVMAVISLVVIFIAPLGSNNNLYQNMNNMFLVMPFTVYMLFKIIVAAWKKKDYTSIPVAVMLYILMSIVLIQGFGFSLNFVFRDGMRGEIRDTQITGIASLEGMYTNEDNAVTIMELSQFMDKQDYNSVILFGDCPGLTYILDKPSALFSSWIDLDSNSSEQIAGELNELTNSKENIPVIVRNFQGTAIAYEEKKNLINDYIDKGAYTLAFENNQYKVYMR